MTNLFRALLDLPIVSRVRRNHGLEHATMHVLSQRHPQKALGGYSDWGGFWIIGDLELEELASAVHEALTRLRSGESRLAVHPTCGTNFATAGILATLATLLAMSGSGQRWRDKLDRLPFAVTMATFALVVAKPLGLRLQEQVTTSGDPGSLQVVRIEVQPAGALKAYRVITTG